MEGQLPLYCGGKRVGTVWRREEGLHSVFTARCVGGEGIRKVWLQGEGGGRLLIGTLVPEGGGWRASRRVARKSLEQQGLTGKLRGEVLAAENREVDLAAFPEDAVLEKLCLKERGCRWTAEKGGWRAVFSWQVGQPVPWLPLFCFARPGKGELSFYLDDKGCPVEGNEKLQK